MPNPENLNQIEIRSDEVHEILNHIPSWIIRWGITVIFLIIIGVLVGAWVIKYPDSISAKIVLTAQNPPAQLIARKSGRINFQVKDYENVVKGQLLGSIENTANIQDVIVLYEDLTQIEKDFSQERFFVNEAFYVKNYNLGELQPAFKSFIKALRDYQLFKDLGFFDKQKRIMEERIGAFHSLREQLEKDFQLASEEFSIIERQYLADSSLYKQRIIALTKFEGSKNNYLTQKRLLESINTEKINIEIQVNQLREQVNSLENQQREKRENLKSSLQDELKLLQSQLNAYKKNYLIISPVEGKVAFSSYWSNNHVVTAGDEMMAVVPFTKTIFGQLEAPVQGSGKLEIGQQVNIKLDNYPFAEYGMLHGQIEGISLLPRNNVYKIRVAIPQNLETTYKKELVFRQNMTGVAEIVTQDLRLIERVFNQIRALRDNL
ncbi:HlyD family efflux transporter periplasmic adaptor subunit [Xanthovirga aplysinae]|uniref:HlyD family efflux transporter periplasmic adaptor subunit n=1 Tax=Xanthovirga aplysinae TaxID=2529853 RepID=UPI0012BCB891|nr:HlyD family efflux transporter periplasmic adaptor subunit [Xanthovirga aplysinae]MTI31233.1 HlyD family efflux transporter periplasmic adaptor subunit [Xanthovirga aplysinae]